MSCDTFVVLPPGTAKGCIIFGKNSDRPADEVQEVVYLPATDYPDGSTLQCTYIEIEQASHTHAVILSKPAWMWGAEMGSNEHGVCIGNEAIWTKMNGPEDKEERLLGMDLLRLALERGSTAREALDVITELLEKYGQGGPCSDIDPEMTYHNSFLITDRNEAWVLETVEKLWAAEKLTSGCRNISNCMSIGTNIDLKSAKLLEHAKTHGFWNPSQGDFDFAKAYGIDSDSERYECGKILLDKLSSSGLFRERDMFCILRDYDSGICMSSGCFISTGSQVSVLSPTNSSQPCCHWFTGTPDPSNSVFKPFIFCPNVRISRHIISPTFPIDEDPAKLKPRFKSKVDRRHNLYKFHEKAYSLMTSENGSNLRSTMRDLEATCIHDMETFLDNFQEGNFKEAEDIFKDVVETEIKFYK